MSEYRFKEDLSLLFQSTPTLCPILTPTHSVLPNPPFPSNFPYIGRIKAIMIWKALVEPIWLNTVACNAINSCILSDKKLRFSLVACLKFGSR